MCRNSNILFKLAKNDISSHFIFHFLISIVIVGVTMLNVIAASVGVVIYKYNSGVLIVVIPWIAAIVVILYGCIILCTVFYLKSLWNRDIWMSFHRLAFTLTEIRKILCYEMVFPCVPGIPLGLIVGSVLGKSVLIKMFFSGTEIEVPWVRIIFIAVIIAIGVTVGSLWVAFVFQANSVENLLEGNDEENIIVYKGGHKRGGRLYRMAWRNLVRERQKTSAAVGFIIIGIVFWNTLYTMSLGWDDERYVNAAINVDFFLTAVDTANVNIIRQETQFVPKDVINKVEKDEAFKEGGCLYHNLDYYDINLKTDLLPKISAFHAPLEFQKDIHGNYFVNLYGADDFVISDLEILEGEIDFDKLRTGNYIIYGLERDFKIVPYIGEVKEDWDYFNVGDKIKLCYGEIEKEYEILAKCAVDHSTAEQGNCWYGGWELTFYLPSAEYLAHKDDEAMRYLCNAKDSKVLEKNIKEYISESENFVSYETPEIWRNGYREEYRPLKQSGMIFCIASGGLGIVVYLCIMINSFIVREREFYLLKCIGMTGRQLKKMVLYEGIYYFLIIMVISIFGSCGLSYLWKILLEIQAIETYSFILAPVCICAPVILAVSILVPYFQISKIYKL